MEYKNLTLAELFRTSFILREFFKKVEQLTKLNRSILNLLDPNLAKQCRVTSYQENILTLTTSSSAWGHTLRFSELELLSAIRQHPEWSGLKAIRIQVRPGEKDLLAPPANSPLPTLKLTPRAAQSLQATATEVTSPNLRHALLKLSKRGLLHGF